VSFQTGQRNVHLRNLERTQEMWLVYFTVRSKWTFLYFVILKEYKRLLFILIPVKKA